MNRLYWILYYKFYKPISKTDIVKAYSRIQGIKYTDIKLSKVDLLEIMGYTGIVE